MLLHAIVNQEINEAIDLFKENANGKSHNLNTKLSNGKTLLHYAIEHYDVEQEESCTELIKEMLDAQADPNVHEYQRSDFFDTINTPLHKAVEKFMIGVVEHMIKKGAFVNAKN